MLAPLAPRAVVNRRIGDRSGPLREPLPHAGSNPHTDPRDPWHASGPVSGVGPSTPDYPAPPPHGRAGRDESWPTRPLSMRRIVRPVGTSVNRVVCIGP